MSATDAPWLDADAVSSVTRPPEPASSTRLAGQLHRITVAGRFLLRSVATLLAGRLTSEYWQGTEPGTGKDLYAFYCGSGENRAYLHQQLFGATSSVPAQQRPRHWLLQLSHLRPPHPAAELLLLDLPFPLNRLIGHHIGIAVPAWLKQKVTIADTWEAVLAGLRRKTRREVLRLIGKHQLRARVVPAAAVARRFYRTLYRPYIEQRYQQGATLVSERRFVRESRHSEVIELLQGDRLLGAALLRRHGSELAVVWTGLDSASGADTPQGVTDALDFFSLLHAYQSGCTLLNLGGSRADLQDGLLRYKRKWGARIEVGRVPHTLLRIAPLRDTAAVRGFLQRHSFIALEAGDLVGKVSLLQSPPPESLSAPPGDQSAAPDELLERLWIEGLQRCDVLCDRAPAATPTDGQLRLVANGADRPVWNAFWHLERLQQ